MSGRSLGLVGAGLALGGVLLIGAGAAIAAQPGAGTGDGAWGWTAGMMGGGPASGIGSGMMGGSGTGMMGGAWSAGATSPGPGAPGFVAGTTSAPRVVRILALPNLRFTPDTVRVQAGETIRFDVTVMGPVTHEFMVGPAADVAADKAGTPEVADISMMQTATLTYTFTGSGPFAYACHAPGHYEAGMTGTIVVVG
jgi:uncharacterized cupredoxin-like copper-binding protein